MARCEECGAEVSYEDKFCKNCGTRVRLEKIPSSAIEEKQEADEEELKERLRLKKELENAIRAFKRGEITIDEFQKKKNIVAEELKNITRKKELKKELRETKAKTAEEKLFELQREAREKTYAPAYQYEGEAIKETGEEKISRLSKKSLYIGVAALFVVAVIGGLFLMKSKGIWIFQKKGETPKSIEVIGGTKGESEKLSSSLVQINLNLSDLGEGFEIDERNTGLLKDPIKFAGGDTELSKKLASQGWKENHRIVLMKMKNGSLIMQVDSSISKYDLNEAKNFTFKAFLEEKKKELENAGYSVSSAAIDDSAIKGEYVKEDIVYYKIVLYKKDIFAEIEVSGAVRKVTEEDAVKYANTVAGRV